MFWMHGIWFTFRSLTNISEQSFTIFFDARYLVHIQIVLTQIYQNNRLQRTMVHIQILLT